MLLRRYHDLSAPTTNVEYEQIENLTVKEIKKLLDGKGVEYDTRARKDDLIKLLKDLA